MQIGNIARDSTRGAARVDGKTDFVQSREGFVR